MKKKVAIAVIAVLCIAACIIAYYLYRMWPMLSTTMGRVEQTQEHQSHRASGGSSDEEDVSVVYMTEEITPEGLMNAYQALGVELTGDNIGMKLSTGEPGSNYLDPDLIADLVHHVNGTIVECNTAYQGSRTETQMHYQVASDHGFTDIADLVIMDEDGSATIPVEGGARMTENLVGAHFPEYDGFLVLSHFKGHAIAGFGGAHQEHFHRYGLPGGEMPDPHRRPEPYKSMGRCPGPLPGVHGGGEYPLVRGERHCHVQVRV